MAASFGRHKLQQWVFEDKKQGDQSQVALAQRHVVLVGMS